MTSDDVKRLIAAEVGADWDRENAHGCSLRRSLVEPQRLRLLDPLNDTPAELWVVLEEDPESRDGYKVVYDEVGASFGLATPGFDGEPSLLGFYGGFLRTFDAM